MAVPGAMTEIDRSGRPPAPPLLTRTLVLAGTAYACEVFCGDQLPVTVALLFSDVPFPAVTRPVIWTVQVSPPPGIEPPLQETRSLLSVQ